MAEVRRRSAFAPPAPPPEPEPPAPTKRGEIVLPGQAESFDPFDSSNWTEERRQAQRQRMQRLMAEGRVGGQNGFGRKRIKKIQEFIAENYQQQPDLIIARLDGMLNQQKDKRLQLEAIREIFKAEEWATKNIREEERFYREMNEDELQSHLLEMMGEALGLDLTGITLSDLEADVVEDGREIEDAEEDDDLAAEDEDGDGEA